jgi:hypothetical protein
MLIPPAPTEPTPSDLIDPVQELLNRPVEHRAREYRYRFAQTVVFGLPVVGLWAWGPMLDPNGYGRWGTVLEALLTGWILYVNAGMVIEGLMLRRVTGDLVVSSLVVGMYGWGVVWMIGNLVSGAGSGAILFLVCVVVLGGWTGVRWVLLRNR